MNNEYMHILQALEEYIELSKNLPILPNILNKFTKHNGYLPGKTKENSDNITQNDTNNFQPARNDKLTLPLFTARPEQSISDLFISNEQIPCFLGKEELACIPIISNGKWMGVIVTEEESTNLSDLSKKDIPVKGLDKKTSEFLHTSPWHLDESKSAGSELASVPLKKVRSVLHEINTPLSIIKNYMHILGDKLDKQNIAKDEIRIIKEEIDRVSYLLTTLSGSSIENVEKRHLVNINEQIRDLEKIMREPLAIHSKVEMTLDVENTLPLIYAEKNNIKQIFINLIKNSIDAMPDGGCLNIQTRYIQNLNENKNTGYQESKGNLEITVSDNGMGIPSEIKSKIFMPFFSSKKNSHSGVGLSIVQDIVQSLHGTITCKNNDDKGASFKITFPIYDSALHHYGIPA